MPRCTASGSLSSDSYPGQCASKAGIHKLFKQQESRYLCLMATGLEEMVVHPSEFAGKETPREGVAGEQQRA